MSILRRATTALAAVLAACGVANQVRGADSNSLAGIHWWGYYDYGVVDSAPAAMLDSTTIVNGQPYGAWNLEVINTHGPVWQNAPYFQPLYNDLYNNKKVTPITRVEYEYGKTVPSPSTINSQTWANNHVVPLINALKDGGHYWQLGNEPNIIGEGVDWANGQVTPAGYAQVYKDVRAAIQSSAQVGAPGAHKLLVAPVSPGGVIPGTRWISGNDWLGQTIDALQASNTPIDGIALHAYDGGGGVQQFMADITQQIEVIDSKGLGHVPLFLTEWNRYSGPNPPDATAEANAANFLRGALKDLNRWNRTPGNHNIAGTTWFVYDSGDRNNTATAPWAGFSIKYWKTAGNAYGTNGDLQTAMEQAVDQRYAAGYLGGTRPIPSSIVQLDNFETGSPNGGNGHFDKPLSYAGSSLYGFAANSSVSRDAGANYSKQWGQKIQVFWNGDSRGWVIRHASGTTSPASNVQIPIQSSSSGEESIGFFLRTAATGLKTQLLIDSNGLEGGANTDGGRILDVIGDDEWHFYEWNLLNPTDWTAQGQLFPGSDGIIPGPGGYVTIDSILFSGPTANATLWFDFVGVNNNGSLDVMTGVPEPSSLSLLALGALALRRRRRGNHGSGSN